MQKMKRMQRVAAVWTAGLLLIAGAGTAAAQEWAKANLAQSPRHGEYVTLHEPNGRNLQAWVVYPEVKTKAPVVVLVHEIFGESDWFREMADELAGAGYIAVAPDLLSGLGPTSATVTAAGAPGADHNSMDMTPGAPGSAYQAATPGGTSAFPDQGAVVKAVTALPDAQVMADLDAAADYGKKLPSANGKLFVAGFCWGGGKSFSFATHRHDLAAALVFYGTPPPADTMRNITAPVYGFYAENDARVTSTVPQTVKDMKAAGKVYQPIIYPGAGHGFMRAGETPSDVTAPLVAAGKLDPRQVDANAAARLSAFQRTVKLLGSTGQ